MRVFLLLSLWAVASCLWAESIPDWLIPLREAVYEQTLNADKAKVIYQTARTQAAAQNTGIALDLAYSRCEYLFGRILQEEKRNEEARSHYVEGMRLAEKVIAAAPSAEAWVSLAENLSQNCSLGPWTYTAANGLNVEKFSRNALSYNKRNASAQYMIAARWVFAPAPFYHYKKGIEMMEAILTESDMDKNDTFNVYSAIAYAYIQQKKTADARPYLLKSLEIYPTNKYAREMLDAK